MKIIGEGCRVFDSGDGVETTHGTWTARARICHATGAEKVTQTVSEYATGKSPAVLNPGAEEVLYVVSGEGSCSIDGVSHDLRPGTGVYIPPGAEYVIENLGSDLLKVVSACCPEDPNRVVREQATRTAGTASRQLTVNEADRKSLPATAGREFRLLIDKDLGCEQVTQFVGWIPPSVAPFHHHLYEEAVFILDGHGIVHAGDEECEFGPGTSIYLPVGVRHCLENPGTSAVRLLGVFFPSGSPAAAYQK